MCEEKWICVRFVPKFTISTRQKNKNNFHLFVLSQKTLICTKSHNSTESMLMRVCYVGFISIPNKSNRGKNEFQKCSGWNESKKKRKLIAKSPTRVMAERQMFCHTYSRYHVELRVSDYEIILGNALWSTRR